MKYFFVLLFTGFFLACNNENSSEAENPIDPNEAIPDSLRIINDSVIVIDSNNQGVDATTNDTSRTKMY